MGNGYLNEKGGIKCFLMNTYEDFGPADFTRPYIKATGSLLTLSL